jgi:lysozyme family protein
MNPNAELQYELGRATNSLRRRQASTCDASEQKALTRVIRRLNKKLVALDKTDFLGASVILSDSVDDLEAAVAAANHGPFDGYLSALEGHLDTLANLSGAMHGAEALSATPDDGEAAAPTAKSAAGKMSRGLAGGLGQPSSITDFAGLKAEYAAWYAACQVRPERKGEVAYYLKRLDQGKGNYQQVGADLDIPWVFIGITHGMECGFNFKAHLHNGDPLSARTVQVPKGRPASGNPPFTWSQSARDALIYKGYHQITDWSVPHMLHLFERYNGMGYRRRGVPTPYLWSYSNLYEKGKFVADGHFDPEAVSKQCGAALMLKTVLGG